MSTDFHRLIPGVLESATQSLQEARRYARSLEATLDSVLPLVSSDVAREKLLTIREAAAKASYDLQILYDRNAREAFVAQEVTK